MRDAAELRLFGAQSEGNFLHYCVTDRVGMAHAFALDQLDAQLLDRRLAQGFNNDFSEGNSRGQKLRVWRWASICNVATMTASEVRAVFTAKKCCGSSSVGGS